MMLELLETFCAVVEAGSLNRAAERLHVAQPAITRQVRTLERQIGALLLTRTPQGVTLTPAGAAVLVHAREAVAAVRACRAAVANLAAAGAGRLRVAAGLMVTLYVLPPVVTRFRVLHPEVAIDLRPAHQRVALDQLLGYEVDAAVLASPVRSSLLRSTPILHDPLLLVGAPDGDPAPIEFAELQGATLLALTTGTGLHEQIQTALRDHGVACRLVEYPTAETIKTAVALGMGVAILPASAVLEEVRAGTLTGRRILGWPGASRVIHLLVRTNGPTPGPVQAFAALLQEHYGGVSGARRAAGRGVRAPVAGRG